MSAVLLAALLAPSLPSGVDQGVHQAQVAVIAAMPAAHRGYFKRYCVAIVPGRLEHPATDQARAGSVRLRPDPPRTVLKDLRRQSSAFVPASECATVGEALGHRATGVTPVVVVVVGPVEVVTSSRVLVTVKTDGGYLTETFTLYTLENRNGWRIVSEKIFLQA